MKTAALSGALLDYWVAKAEGYEAEIMKDEKGEFVVRTERFENGGHARGPFFPSTNWLDGGPIIEREHITVGPVHTERRIELGEDPLWGAHKGDANEDWRAEEFDGPAPLVAAMRAYVASKFGEDVAQ